MKQQIVVIHGGNAFETYEEYLSSLKDMKGSLTGFPKDWKNNLAGVLGDGYDVVAPQMPNAWNARYLEWKIFFEKLVPLFDENVIFVGHSLGGIFLAKYLSENTYPKKIVTTLLVAAPYNTAKQHPLVDFNIETDLSRLAEQGGQVFLYHSRDDQVVPYSNAKSYAQALPGAILRTFEDRQHFNQTEFPEIVEDIRSL